MDKLKQKNKKAKNKTVFDDNDLSEENIGNSIKDEDNNLEKDIDKENSENNEIPPPVKKKIKKKKKKNTDETRNKKKLNINPFNIDEDDDNNDKYKKKQSKSVLIDNDIYEEVDDINKGKI